MEQSYKEKYEQALEKIKNLIDKDHNDINVDDILNVFPELAESEDEKIRKALKQYFVNSFKNNGVAAICGVHVKDVLAWLEKQGQKEKDILEDAILDGNEDGLIAETIRYKNEKQSEQKFEMKTAEESLGIDSDTYDKIVDECIFGEQKPKENKGNIGVISSNSALSEENEPQKKLVESYLAKFDKKFPILPTLKGKQLADYKNFLNKCQQIFGLKYWGIRPIQAKLFEKLSLLWAAWGAEHLQGLGQTDGDMDNEMSMWSEEDEKILKEIISDVKFEGYNNDMQADSYKKINWLKSLRPQNRWKPSEEQMMALLYHCSNGSVLSSLYNDLKKLKEE